MQSVVALVLSLLVTAPAWGQTQKTSPASPTKAEQEVLNLERELLDAIRSKDASALDRLISGDFSLFGLMSPGGATIARAQFIENTLRHLKFDAARLEKTRVSVYGSTAVVHTLLKLKGTYREQPFDETRAVIDTWVKRKGRWQITARYYAVLPAKQP